MSDLELFQGVPPEGALVDAAALSARFRGPVQVARKWLASFRSENTRAAYQRDVVAAGGRFPGFLQWCDMLSIDPWTLDRFTITLWLNALREHEPAARTVRRKVSAVRGFYDYAVMDGALAGSPWPTGNRHLHLAPIAAESTTRGLSLRETERILAAARAHSARDAAIVAVLYYQGLRASELCDLTTRDVIYTEGRWALDVDGKGDKHRTIGLTPTAKHHLDLWQAEQTEQGFLDVGLALPGTHPGPAPLFTDHHGKPLNRFHVRDRVARAARAAGVEQPETVTPHVFRHTCTTHMLDPDLGAVPMDQVADFLGHASTETTKLYDHRRVNLRNSPGDRLPVLR